MIVTIIQMLWKEGSKKFFYIVKVLLATGLWKEGSKKKNYCERARGHRDVKGRQQDKTLLWRCLWPHGALKFQIVF
jgi:hypothetical protein